jgi:selenide,water dikinase
VLRPLAQRTDPRVLVGLQTSDDAAVFELEKDRAIVQTVDFFTPVVDDPYLYGSIAAANSLSDIFAMGATPLFALNIAAFPGDMDLDVISRILAGGADKAAEAGIVIAGGHTVTDDEPKYGLVVTGEIDPGELMTKAGLEAGDKLYLTKRIGTGVVTTALKQEAAEPEHVDDAIESMRTLNASSSKAARAAGVVACTDVTGFGLLGHATEMAIKSEVGLRITAAEVPLLPGAARYADEGRVPGGGHRNVEYYEALPECGVSLDGSITESMKLLLFGPETSGGLLLGVPSAQAARLEEEFAAAGLDLWSIGEVIDGRGIVVV